MTPRNFNNATSPPIRGKFFFTTFFAGPNNFVVWTYGLYHETPSKADFKIARMLKFTPVLTDELVFFDAASLYPFTHQGFAVSWLTFSLYPIPALSNFRLALSGLGSPFSSRPSPFPREPIVIANYVKIKRNKQVFFGGNLLKLD